MSTRAPAPGPVRVLGGAGLPPEPARLERFLRESIRSSGLPGHSVCLLVPDATRTCPLPVLLPPVLDALREGGSSVTVLVALGTHAPMTEDALSALVGRDVRRRGVTVVNHRWWEAATFAGLGELSAETVRELSDGHLEEAVPVRVNRLVVDHDAVLIVGPVLPHEVVGFSGGNKYLFPGVSGPEMIDASHWLGALLTSAAIIGTRGLTPVRRLIDRAAELVPVPRHCLSVVSGSGRDQVDWAAFGSAEESWRASVEVSARTHIRLLDRPRARVLSLVPARYPDLWTAGKGMYKVEPVVADGGEVVIHAPHVNQVSAVHGADIARIGYHCRDWFLADPSREAGVAKAVVAHSTHVRGAGRYSPAEGEVDRIRVTLATGLDRSTCEALGLGWRDPASIDPDEWARDPDTLVVPDAGEVLYRLRDGAGAQA